MNAAGPWYLIDGIGPFFAPVSGVNRTYNWSKAPFDELETGGMPSRRACSVIVEAFSRFVYHAAAAGFNAVTLDDVAHCADLPMYPSSIRRRLDAYRLLYESLFSIARRQGLSVFLTTDIMPLHQSVAGYAQGSDDRLRHAFGMMIGSVFQRYRDVAGVIVRLGECDGLDVRHDLRSEMVVRRPQQANRYLRDIASLCAEYDRLLVVRTWSVGSFTIGDMQWHPPTFDAVVQGLPADRVLVSMKYGDTDFYRYLSLNPLLQRGPLPRIVELQARREYEGCGEFPSFVGFDYEEIHRQLAGVKDIAGIMVWCQTGGWSRFRKLTYLNSSSLWNELNVSVTMDIFKRGLTAEQSVINFSEQRIPHRHPVPLLSLVRRSETVVKELWYLPGFSAQRFYFRRTRIPPLLWVFWDTIVISHAVRRVVRPRVRDPEREIARGWRALQVIDEMRGFGDELGLDSLAFVVERDTFELLALGREYLIGHWTADRNRHFTDRINAYRTVHPDGFEIDFDGQLHEPRRMIAETLLDIGLRSDPSYRIRDRIFLGRLLGLLSPFIAEWCRRRLPATARNRAMGIEALLR